MEAHCQCGFVRFTTPTPAPLAVYICHCLSCRAQSSSAFGTSAIFPHFTLPTTDPPLGTYTRSTDAGNVLECFFCPKCGSRLLHSAKGKDTVSVKGGCIQNLSWQAAKHIWCKRAVVPIPDGVERWDEEPRAG
ncbi:MAG: hypothetical protein M1833_006294 [Piccolia ochrophora]|nr:MAG: hypothetical protein M1833_006294 [Piccolia ochrophora]